MNLYKSTTPLQTRITKSKYVFKIIPIDIL